jgi:cell division protein FtsL
MITVMLVGVLLAVCVGALVGSTWTTQALEGSFRRHAAERRQLNEEWSALDAQRDQHRWCPRCDGALRWEPATAQATRPGAR